MKPKALSKAEKTPKNLTRPTLHEFFRPLSVVLQKALGQTEASRILILFAYSHT